MKEIIKQQQLEIVTSKPLFIFIHTPFCGTCQLARKMLETIEQVLDQEVFYELNASIFPTLMQEQQIESVPCLLILQQDVVKEKIYAFRSVPHIYSYVLHYQQVEG